MPNLKDFFSYTVIITFHVFSNFRSELVLQLLQGITITRESLICTLVCFIFLLALSGFIYVIFERDPRSAYMYGLRNCRLPYRDVPREFSCFFFHLAQYNSDTPNRQALEKKKKQ